MNFRDDRKSWVGRRCSLGLKRFWRSVRGGGTRRRRRRTMKRKMMNMGSGEVVHLKWRDQCRH